MTKREIINGIYSISDQEDLREIMEAVRLHWGTLQSRQVNDFSLGEEVSFVSGKQVIVGEVAKVNRKTVSVKVGHKTWRVSPSLLQKQVA